MKLDIRFPAILALAPLAFAPSAFASNTLRCTATLAPGAATVGSAVTFDYERGSEKTQYLRLEPVAPTAPADFASARYGVVEILDSGEASVVLQFSGSFGEDRLPGKQFSLKVYELGTGITQAIYPAVEETAQTHDTLNLLLPAGARAQLDVRCSDL